MLVCFFSSLPNDEYLNYLIVAAFCNSLFIGKTSLVENSYLLTFLDDKAEILGAGLSKFY